MDDLETPALINTSFRLSRPLRHSKSQAFDKTVKRDRSVDSVGSVAVATKAPSQRRKKSRVAFQPVSINIEVIYLALKCSGRCEVAQRIFLG